MDGHEGFFSRWSRLKCGQAGSNGDAPPAPDAADAPAARAMDESALEGLGPGSDFARFLAAGIDPDLRTRALRILWDSEPELSAGDGLIDYAGDYTGGGDASMFASAYRIGRGLLSDDEAALWDALGAPREAGTLPERHAEATIATGDEPSS